jgi:hypothetical protein
MSKQYDSSLLSYIHQHVWLSFVSLALRTSYLLHTFSQGGASKDMSLQPFLQAQLSDTTVVGNKASQELVRSFSLQMEHHEYLKLATQLHNRCVQLAVKCLKHVNISEEGV